MVYCASKQFLQDSVQSLEAKLEVAVVLNYDITLNKL